ncbi:MAG: type VI secretion system baseplate subunit TssE [Longimicrobiales bacterium]
MALPRDSKSTDGARALLFDRLVDLDRSEPVEQQPLRVLDVAGVRDSVQRELARLLNTRSPTPPEVLEGREWTVLDWGLPDYTGWYTRSAPSQHRLARLVEATIEAFEPRMVDPRVSVERQEGNDRGLLVWIDGSIKVGTLLEPVSFPLAIDGPTKG